MSKKDKEKKKGKAKQQTNEIVEIKGIGNTGEPFKKGLAIIVGNKPDGILVHVAKLLGKDIQFLDIMRTINCSDDDIIYLIGHGDSKKHTIDKREMKYIAEKLCKAGYNGKQLLYITSCEANKKFLGKSIRQLLKKELYSRNIQCKVLSHFDGLSIIISNGDIVEGHNVKPCKTCEKCGDCKQDNFIKSHPYTRKGIYMTVREFIEVNNFKIKLINILED